MIDRSKQVRCDQCRRYVRPDQISFKHTCMTCARANVQAQRADKSSHRTEKEIWDDFRENGFQ